MAGTTRQFDRIAESLAASGALARDPASVRRRIEAMERVLERLFTLPGTNRQMGLDVLLDALPVVGDVIAAALGAWIVWEARNLGMSKMQIARMAGNVGVDALLGAIPWVGAIPDFFFRSNSRNLKIVKRFLDKHHPETATIDAMPLPARKRIGG